LTPSVPSNTFPPLACSGGSDVRDGDHVTAGQILIELDPTQSGADRDSLTGQLASARAEAARYAAEASVTPLTASVPPPDVPEAIIAQAAADFLRNALTQQQEADKKVATLTQDLAKAEQRQGLQMLTAPIAGTVQELVIHTEGGVVQQAQKLLSIVPDDSGLEIEARLPNRDVGFVVEGQAAEIKLDAFQYTKYGTIPGTVTRVSRDAVPDDKLGLLYPLRVALSRSTMDVGPRTINLGPGLSAPVEIKTETRRVIEYLISSLQRYKHDAMRER